MRKFTSFVVLAAALAIPAAAFADEPTTTEKSNAAKECKALLKAQGTTNFTHAWGAKGKGKAYGKCVSSTAKKEAQQNETAHSNAAKDCKAEKAMTEEAFKAAHDGKTFAEFYGAKNASSAYGKCVSTKAKANKAEADQQDQDKVNASKFCRGEQVKDAAAFNATYKNFGACVSKKAHELNAAREQARTETQTQQA